MFLKKLKIDGFKSFAKPIVIDFQSPLTAIVGPNGSGKSNIVDAIRWALGEQSAKTLRGSRMADVIFAGSDDYKPLHKASVTLFLDNSDHVLPIDAREVRICRRVTDNGQSDYLINGSPCRLKDIEELLLDTGMGKDSYSIVGQGKIDSILNSKPEKLRELFEEAAGISKHKLRKEEAEKRLDKTNQDLQRVKDLIWELEKQVKPLKKAAEKARKYQRLKKELKELEVSLLLDRWERNLNNLLSLREEKTEFQRKLERLKGEIEELNQFLQEKRGNLEQEQENLDTLQNEYYQTKAKKEEAENNLKILAERNYSLKREDQGLEEQLASLMKRKEELNRKKDNLESQLTTLGVEESNISRNLETERSSLEGIKHILKEKKMELFSLRNSILNDNVELKNINTELEKAKEKSHYLELEIEKMHAKRKGLASGLDENLLQQDRFKKDLNQVAEKLETCAQEVVELKNRKEELAASLKNHRENGEELKDKLNRSSSRLRVLSEMEDNFEGYYRGVKTIMKAVSDLPGVIGVVADQLEVAKEHELAVETALGSRLQNIIVEDDRAARRGIAFLKENDGGRATFLPLNMVRGNRAKVDKMGIEKMEGFLGLAADFVSCESCLRPVIDYLLGRTIVADNLKNATGIAKKINSRLKIVTLSGDLINPGGAITGGSNSINTGLLQRSRELAELRDEISYLKKTIAEEGAAEKELAAELDKITGQEEELKDQIQQLKFKKNDLNKDLANLKKEQYRFERELEQLDQDFIEYHNQLGSIDSRKQELQQKIDLINNDYSKEKEKIKALEEEIERIEGREEEFNQHLTGLKVKAATVRQKRENLVKEKEDLLKELANNQEEIEKSCRRRDEITAGLQEIRDKKNNLKELKERFAAKTSCIDRQCQEKSKLLKELQQGVERLRDRLQETQQELDSFKDSYHRLDLKITRLEDKNEQIEERLLEEYEVTPDSATTERIEISNYSRAVKKIKEFKEAIRGLGTVNQGAIQELEDLQSRLDYLQNQHRDLLEAKDSITKVITEIERNMGELFYKSFLEVKTQFEKTFKELFNGGQAELKLTRPDNLLETGVEIVAQPPGKQLKKLSLMSGGERALTAIALVFAFLKVNPSPIYILDEIDAPLDDANVLRFARFIKEYSHYVQFILITHNKNMMAETNTIYGITMEESGVSKLVSLRLDEEIA